jgi:hypothetical protein
MQLLTSFYLPINHLQTITTNTQLPTTDFLLPTKNYRLKTANHPKKGANLHENEQIITSPVPIRKF